MSFPRSRSAQSARNASVSILVQIVVIALGFVTRTVFVAELGVALLGVNSLLTSALALLAIVDLGLSGAFMFALYKPLNDGDTEKTAIIVRYAGRLYGWVALAVSIVGLAFMPFIQHIVHLEEEVTELEIYYVILLANTVAEYLMQNRLILLQADQKIYLTKILSLVFNILRSTAQIVSLIIFESFIIFLLIQVFFTIANNLMVYLRAGRLYPYIKKTSESIGDPERLSILRSTRALLIYRVGGLALNNSTPLLVSLIVGTVTLGYYSNYILIIGSAVMITEVAFAALTPSVGNLVAAGSPGSNRDVFDEMVLLSILIHGVFSVGFMTLVDDFVALWLGPEFVLPPAVVVAIVLNFYMTGTMMPLLSFRSATGLFRKTRFVIIITAVISISLSFALGSMLGLFGILIAPAIARILTGTWYEPWILIRDHLGGKALPYFGLQLGSFATWGFIATLTTALGTLVPGGTMTSMLLKAVFICCFFPLASWLAFRRTRAFQSLFRRFQALIPNTSHGARKD